MRYLALSLLPALALAVDVEAAKLATPDAMPVDPGSFEVALGLEWGRSRSAYDANGDLQDRGGSLIEREFALGFTAGLVENLDAGITVGYARTTDGAADPDHGSGPTDVALGAKWRFLHAENVALALIPEISLPVGDGKPEEEISSGSNLWGAGLTLAATASFDRLAIGAALSRGWVTGKDQDRGDARGSIGADLALGWQATEMVQPEIELHYARDLNAGDTEDAWVLTTTAGVLVSTDYGRFGAGVDQAIAGKDAERTTTVLLQWVKGF
jgi:hypothetical protein